MNQYIKQFDGFNYRLNNSEKAYDGIKHEFLELPLNFRVMQVENPYSGLPPKAGEFFLDDNLLLSRFRPDLCAFNDTITCFCEVKKTYEYKYYIMELNSFLASMKFAEKHPHSLMIVISTDEKISCVWADNIKPKYIRRVTVPWYRTPPKVYDKLVDKFTPVFPKANFEYRWDMNPSSKEHSGTPYVGISKHIFISIPTFAKRFWM